MIFKKTLEETSYVCQHCKKHFRMSAYDRLATLLDEDSFEEYFTDLVTKNVLESAME